MIKTVVNGVEVTGYTDEERKKMSDDKVKARIERYSHDLFGSDSHPYSGMRENDEGDFVSHEDYLALQSELKHERESYNRLHENYCDEVETLTKQRDELLASLNAEEMAHNETKKERDGLRAALESIAQVLPPYMGNSDVKEALVDRLIIARKALEGK